MTGTAPDPMDDQTTAGPPGLPAWVKLLTIGAVVAVILLGLLLLAGGEHGPGMHDG